jgi:hypothetical protein
MSSRSSLTRCICILQMVTLIVAVSPCQIYLSNCRVGHTLMLTRQLYEVYFDLQ